MEHSPTPWTHGWMDRSPVRLLDANNETLAMVYLTDQKTRKRTDRHTGNLALFLAAPKLAQALQEILAGSRAKGVWRNARMDEARECAPGESPCGGDEETDPETGETITFFAYGYKEQVIWLDSVADIAERALATLITDKGETP